MPAISPDNAETVRATAQLVERASSCCPTCSLTSSARATWYARARQPSCRWQRHRVEQGLTARDFLKIIVDKVDVPRHRGREHPTASQAFWGAMELGMTAVMADHRGGHDERRSPSAGGRVQTRAVEADARDTEPAWGATRPRRGLVAPHRVPRGLGGE